MQIDIRAHGFSLTGALRDYTERRLRFALTRVAGRVRLITVRFFDINGPRGGIDKRCRIRVILNGLAAVVIEDTEADLYLGVDRAVDRIGRTVMRRLARHNARPAKNPLATRRSRRADGSPDQPIPMKGSET